MIQKSEDLSQNIEERLLTAYRKIRSNARNGLAVVTVDRDACGGCFNKIPPQRQLDIRSRKKIIVCEYCGRILIDKYICDYDGSMQKADLESAMEAQRKRVEELKNLMNKKKLPRQLFIVNDKSLSLDNLKSKNF